MEFKILLLFLLNVYKVSSSSCPRQEYLFPSCFCKGFDTFSMLFCSNIVNAEELISPMKATEGFNIMSINIEDSSLLYIPSEIFKNTKFEKIRFGNSQVMSLSNTDLAFVGLEDYLEEIRATGASYVTMWDWSQLRNHRRLNLIDINMISMYSLDNEFPHLDSLESLGITKAEISYIHPKAFHGLSNLNLLNLKDNNIKEMNRNMLPNPATNMRLIDLSNNELSDLPDNMFVNMPNLKELYLSNNKFITLKEDTFKSLFNTLQHLMLNGNKFRCDCRLQWMVNIKIPMYFEAACHEPQSMHGNDMKYLKHKDLYC